MKLNVLCFGEVLFDNYIQKNKQFIGGAPFNTAVHFSRQENNVYLLSSMGDDELGKKAQDSLEKEHINLNFISKKSNPTGSVDINLDDKASPTFKIKENVAWDNIDVETHLDKIKSIDWDVFYFGTLALRSKHNLEQLKKLMDEVEFTNVVLDLNIRPPYASKEIIQTALGYCDFLKISQEDYNYMQQILALGDDRDKNLDKLIDEYSLKLIVLTDGEKGGSLFFGDGMSQNYEAEEVQKVVNTVGAGDSLMPTFLNSILKGDCFGCSIRKAISMASYIVTQEEATPEYSGEILQKISMCKTS